MTPYKPKGRHKWMVRLPRRHGGWRAVSTGNQLKHVAKAMERMLHQLGRQGERAWDLLEAVNRPTNEPGPRITMGQLYDAFNQGSKGLARLRAELADVDLAEHIGAWDRYLTGRISPGERVRYRAMLDRFRPAKGTWMASTVTTADCERWLSGLAHGPATKRKYFAALASFFGYLADVVKVIAANPMDGLTPPPAPEPRVEFYDLDEVIRIVQGSEEPYRGLFALLYGTGIEVTCALGLQRRDVDLRTLEIRARGTKTHNRDRVAVLAEWATPYVERACLGKLPDAPLFPGLDRWKASKSHKRTVEALGLRPLRVHEARDHWAVRMIRAGTPIELIARQLGHVNAVMALRVYGRFIPTSEERRGWDQVATTREARK